MDMNDWLPEQLKTARNLITTAELIISLQKYELLPTILECLQLEVQEMIYDNCVVSDGQAEA